MSTKGLFEIELDSSPFEGIQICLSGPEYNRALISEEFVEEALKKDTSHANDEFFAPGDHSFGI